MFNPHEGGFVISRNDPPQDNNHCYTPLCSNKEDGGHVFPHKETIVDPLDSSAPSNDGISLSKVENTKYFEPISSCALDDGILEKFRASFPQPWVITLLFPLPPPKEALRKLSSKRDHSSTSYGRASIHGMNHDEKEALCDKFTEDLINTFTWDVITKGMDF